MSDNGRHQYRWGRMCRRAAAAAAAARQGGVVVVGTARRLARSECAREITFYGRRGGGKMVKL